MGCSSNRISIETGLDDLILVPHTHYAARHHRALFFHSCCRTWCVTHRSLHVSLLHPQGIPRHSLEKLNKSMKKRSTFQN